MIDYKKSYYYIICLIAFFILMWGAIDFTSAGSSFVVHNYFSSSDVEQKPPLDDFYQEKMIKERLSDSLVRLIISGVVFVYCRKKAADLEGGR